MAKIKDLKRFSGEFKLPSGFLRKAGSFDPLLNVDTKLFIDPLLLEKSAHPEMLAAYKDWRAHFADIIKLLKATKGAGDVAWKAADKMFDSPEFKGTCLGYGSASIVGSGIGPKLRARLLRTAHEIVKLGIEDPTLFPLLALLEEDVGPDRISDLTTRAIGHRLAEFTTRVLTGQNIPSQRFDVFGSEFSLPVNPHVSDRGESLPVVLTPLDVLRALPVASDWSDVDRVKSENDKLRRRINQAIGAVWLRHTDQSKAKNRAAFLKDKEAFDSLLAAVRSMSKAPYDFAGDPEGRVNWLELGIQLAGSHPLKFETKPTSKDDVRAIVEAILAHYGQAIEHRGLWKNLYDSNGDPHHEHYAQRLFYAMALSYCKANDVGIDPESNAGVGPVDFVISVGFQARVVVELKLSTNTSLKHGYVKQLEEYKAGHETDAGFFVVLDVGGGNGQIKQVLRLESTARNNKEPHSQVVVVDGTKKRSASKS